MLALPGPGTAQSPGTGALEQKQAALDARARAAVVELYGLESRLAQARTDLARVDAQATRLARVQASLRRRYAAATATLRVAQERLGAQLRLLYEHGRPDAIAVVLGAASLEDAIESLEALKQATRATERVLDQTRSARKSLAGAKADLTAQVKRTKEARALLADTAAGLERARAERAGYLTSLRREQELTAAELTRVRQEADAARVKAAQVTRQAEVAAATPQAATPQAVSPPATTPSTTTEPDAAPTPTAASGDPSEPPPSPVDSVQTATEPAPAATPPPPRPGGTMTVLATAYCLRGTTATGLPVGPGIVATDPTVIPLGTRMTIPGYGEGVAADTGSAITGAKIDVWIGDCAKALAFTRTVTITFR